MRVLTGRASLISLTGGFILSVIHSRWLRPDIWDRDRWEIYSMALGRFLAPVAVTLLACVVLRMFGSRMRSTFLPTYLVAFFILNGLALNADLFMIGPPQAQ